MGAFGNFLRSLTPGNDHQLAADLSQQRRTGHRRNTTAAARQGQAWEDRDRAQDRRGSWYRPAR